MSWTQARQIARSYARASGFSRAAIDAADFGGQLAGLGAKAIKRKMSDDSGVEQTPQKKAVGPSRKKIKLMPSVNNRLVNKSAMSVKGKAAVKRKKTLKVSRRLRESIHQVLSGASARGTYTVLRTGLVGSCMATGGGSLSLSTMGSNQIVALFSDPGVTPIGSRSLWNCLAQHTIGGSPGALALSDMNYFTPAKILDAASVLFNEKAPSNPYLTANNLSETTLVATGAPVESSPTLKINIISSSVVWRMKNVSNRIANIEIWECTPTLKFQPINALNALSQQLVAFQSGAIDEPVEYYTGTGSGTINGGYLFEQAYDPLAVSKAYQGFPFKWKKRTMVLHPDETCVHTIKGPKGILDFRNLVTSDPAGVGSLVQLNPLLKNYSVSCVISVNGDQVLKPGISSQGTKDHFYAGSGVGFGLPISIEVEERYRIAVPDIAGFRTAALAAGGRQQLNFRKNRYKFWNQLPVQTATNTAVNGYVVSSKENFVADTVAGSQFQ